jgi:flagellar export protein FliJ
VDGPQNLRRVYDVRKVQERQRRAQMESAIARLRLLQNALMAALESAKRARTLIAASVSSGEQVDRIAALQEITTSERRRKFLQQQIAIAEAEVASMRQEFMGKRVERRQVESLLDAARMRLQIEENHKIQTALDDWHLSRLTGRGKVVSRKISGN